MTLNVLLNDVGDGLNGALFTVCGRGLHLDVGGNSPGVAWGHFQQSPNPRSLVISHFHFDHYCGLLVPDGARQRPLHIQRVFFPRLPQFAQRREFAIALYTTMLRAWGHETGSIEADFLRVIGRLNSVPWTYTPLSKGEVFCSEHRVYEVLWPPRDYDDQSFTGEVGSALDSFERAAREDLDLQTIRGEIEALSSPPFLEEVVESRSAPDRNEFSSEALRETDDVTGYRRPYERELPAATRAAVRDLRRVANRVSLAFRSVEEVLFLGDLETEELGRVASVLVAEGLDAYALIIAAHHGTHWHANLGCIRTIDVVASNGPRMVRRFRREYTSISLRSHQTGRDGAFIRRLPV